MKQFSCGDVVPGCQRRFEAADEPGVLALVSAHARDDHQLDPVPADVAAAVRERILTV